MEKSVKELLAEPDKILFDVRTKEEVAEGALEGAVNYDFLSGEFATQIPSLDKEKLYLLYCRSGGRSGMAADLLKQHGFKNVINIGGYVDLKNL